jgi:hypothetical protein
MLSNRGRGLTKEAAEMKVEVLMKVNMETEMEMEMVVESLAEALDELRPPTLELLLLLSQLLSGARMMTMLCGWGLEQ